MMRVSINKTLKENFEIFNIKGEGMKRIVIILLLLSLQKINTTAFPLILYGDTRTKIIVGSWIGLGGLTLSSFFYKNSNTQLAKELENVERTLSAAERTTVDIPETKEIRENLKKLIKENKEKKEKAQNAARFGGQVLTNFGLCFVATSVCLVKEILAAEVN